MSIIKNIFANDLIFEFINIVDLNLYLQTLLGSIARISDKEELYFQIIQFLIDLL